MKHAVFALLDDANRGGRLYTGFVRSVDCVDPSLLDADWQQVEAAMADGLHALVMADYEWGVRLQGVTTGRSEAGQGGALRVLLFRRLLRCSRASVGRWLASAEGLQVPGARALRALAPSISEAEFAQALARIQSAITEGETYQVNFSYRLHAEVGGEPLALYRRLRARQPVAYGALIALPPGMAHTHVLSFSPELFLRHEAGLLTARPMKGTAPRHDDIARDLLAREQLANAKNRAENLMIVDLLRNDLGRVACIGSVRVPALFDIEAHATVWQMTSTITAQRSPDQTFPDLLRALFPCGSITGAPKHRTMQLIDALESDARGIYCGAIGWISPAANGHACGDFCLSVPIRTLTLQAPIDGWRPATLGLGAGIVADSEAAREHAECQLKANFVTGTATGFALIETMFADASGIRHGEKHLQRLHASAAALGFVFDRERVAGELAGAVVNLRSPHRLRCLLYPDGHCEIALAPLEPNPHEPVPVMLTDDVIDSHAWPLQHKTTLRAPYDRSLVRAQALEVFDLLHVNRRGEVTEGARTNVFVRIDGVWLTPALTCGVLPGIMRSVLLADPAWAAREAVLTPADLSRAQDIVVCNALRGILRARLVHEGATSG